eukprot:CAMPEP_0185545628 /NCGR_PEP_ID=MMETSP1381-20130426/4922_1 /TAXON_ID=298111 /ORGANISM="Pavlova sp., Strain CCMP459" /LENGTH=63 /DNA_ID=CAMNT_0028157987 /DNA_START=347 /DNA_END=538 /DNA_ORIENTATION=+
MPQRGTPGRLHRRMEALNSPMDGSVSGGGGRRLCSPQRIRLTLVPHAALRLALLASESWLWLR